MISDLKLLFQIAMRNVFASFLNVIIGGIILFGTLFFVVGGSFLNSVDTAMSRSIIGSVAGHIQVYADGSKDELALFSDWGFPEIKSIPDFSKVKQTLLSIENVKAVVPMGVNGASIMVGNTADLALERLRKAVNLRLKGDRSKTTAEKIESLKSHVRQMVGVIQGDYRKLALMASADSVDPKSVADLEIAASPSFWAKFDGDPLANLEFLENRISSLIPDADFIFLGYVGTDLDAFSKSFDRMEIVDGQRIPEGRRGILLAKYTYENQFKMKTALRLDQIHEALAVQGKKIATDPDLQLKVKQNKAQTREFILQLDPRSDALARTRLQQFFGSNENDLNKLLVNFYDVNDANFSERYAFFYKMLVPLVELYRVRPGDMLPIKAYTKSGFVQSANLKVYGTFQFKGLEKSGLAGGMSLMDLVSFRDLYGFVTPEKIAESRQLAASAGAKIVDRDRIESDLFGGASSVVEGKEKRINDAVELGDERPLERSESFLTRVYSSAEIEKGTALNAAIILKDPSRIKETMKEIEAAVKRDELNLRVVDWQKAAGFIGQFVFVAKAVLYFAVFIIFVVALVIINNAVMMATLQRVREIGTMRAIGAQRTFVLSMVVVETLMLGLIFGLIGTGLGAGIVSWLGKIGVPAPNEFFYFFFSGPRLFVSLSPGTLFGSFTIIGIVTAASALYPAIVATRFSPVQAMQSED